MKSIFCSTRRQVPSSVPNMPGKGGQTFNERLFWNYCRKRKICCSRGLIIRGRNFQLLQSYKSHRIMHKNYHKTSIFLPSIRWVDRDFSDDVFSQRTRHQCLFQTKTHPWVIRRDKNSSSSAGFSTRILSVNLFFFVFVIIWKAWNLPLAVFEFTWT